MVQRSLPFVAFGSVALAAITAHVLGIPFRKDSPGGWLIPAYFLPALFFVWLRGALVRRKRLRDWCAAEGTIQSCDKDSLYRGTQIYRCAYLFSPDEARQGGSFLISERATDSDTRLDEIRKELVGYTVQVRYDPKDCTRCIVEDKQVLDWQVEND